LVVAEFGVAGQRPGFDHRSVFDVSKLGTGRASPIRQICQHGQARRLAIEKVHTYRPVPDVSWGQITRRDNPRLGFHRNMGFVSVAITGSGLVHMSRFGIHC